MYHQPPYLREVWHYKVANTNLIRRAINKFKWEKPFSDTDINPILHEVFYVHWFHERWRVTLPTQVSFSFTIRIKVELCAGITRKI